MTGGVIGREILGLAGALTAALCYGSATVLQAVGARRIAGMPAGAGLWVRARAGRLYAVGLVLDGLGFLASVAALRTLPLFVVQAAVASSVAVTALLAVAYLDDRLRRSEVTALVAIGVGLVGLAASASPGEVAVRSGPVGWLVLAGVVPVALLAAVGLAPTRRAGSGVVPLALAAGLGFGGVGIGARVLVVPDRWWHVVADPALWAVVAHAVVATVCYGVALTRGAASVVAALTFGADTVVPALIGIIWLGDSVRPGWAVPAAVAFALAIGGCLALAGKAEVAGPVH